MDAVLSGGSPAAVLAPVPVRQATHRVVVTREVLFPACAVAVIVASADVRLPMGIPGHRGLIWLTLLVAVALLTHRKGTVVAVGGASMLATLWLHTASDPWGSGRYLAAAILLSAVVAAPVTERRRWLVALAAAPIHLVALAGSLAALLSRGYLPVSASVGMAEKTLCHLMFGLLAGLLGWLVAGSLDRFPRGEYSS